MTTKRTELEMRKALKVTRAPRRTDNCFDAFAGLPRRTQRECDRAAGLGHVAVRLSDALVQQLHEAAQQSQLALNDHVDQLLRSALNSKESPQ